LPLFCLGVSIAFSCKKMYFALSLLPVAYMSIYRYMYPYVRELFILIYEFFHIFVFVYSHLLLVSIFLYLGSSGKTLKQSICTANKRRFISARRRCVVYNTLSARTGHYEQRRVVRVFTVCLPQNGDGPQFDR
jgi:hypothetical protein